MTTLRSLQLSASLLLIFCLTACHNVQFSPGQDQTPSKLQDPVVDPNPPSPLLKSGLCQDKESILSCLQCESPSSPNPPRPLTKALKLAKIMKMSCPIDNKSYPKDYVAPAPASIDQHLLACTSDLYPETEMTLSQSQTMDQLLNETDDTLRIKMFRNIWYQPPYTDDFALYFGLDNKEAALVFCLDQEISGPLITLEYVNASLNWWDYARWENNPEAQTRWNKAQQQRAQLLSCLNKPGQAPSAPSPSTPTAKKCQYQSFEGLYSLGGRNQISRLLREGYKVAIETGNSCGQLTTVPDSTDFQESVKIVGYRCH